MIRLVNGSISDRSPGKPVFVSYPTIKKTVLLDSIEKSNDGHLLNDLIKSRLGNEENYTINGQFNITAFLMDASIILEKMNVEPNLRKMILDSAILHYLPKDINRDLVKNMIEEHAKLYVALYQKKQSNERNVVDSKFVKISDTQFIERRDGKFYFLEYDEKTGEIIENEIANRFSDTLIRFPKETVDRFGGTVGRMNYEDRKSGRTIPYTIMFNEDFSIVTVNGRELQVMKSPEKLGDSFLIDEIMSPLLDGIKDNRYVSILEDGEKPVEGARYTWVLPDTRSRIINYKLFLEELKLCISHIPKELRTDIEKSAISCLISRTYLVKPEDITELQSYIEGLTLRSIGYDSTINKLYEFTEKLNQSRRNYVEKESEHNGISFATEEARHRWTESLKAKEEKKRRTEFNQDIDAFVITNSVSCILEPLEVRTDEQHYSTIEGIRYRQHQEAKYRTASAAKVDYDSFCEQLKEALSGIDETKRMTFVKRVISNSIEIWYGNGYGYPEADRIIDERSDLEEELQSTLISRVMSDATIDMVRIREIEEQFLELSRQEEERCQKILETREPESFENDQVQTTYSFITSIQQEDSIPAETKKTLIQDLKKKNTRTIEGKRKMSAFAKLALSGEHTPSASDIKTASKLLDFYREQEARQ